MMDGTERRWRRRGSAWLMSWQRTNALRPLPQEQEEDQEQQI
jgi:hypothetical protein